MHEEIAALIDQEGWRAEGAAARVHYDGGGNRVAIEFYAAAERVLYWTVPTDEDRDTAAPIPRETVPNPLRRRIREDLDAAGVDPAIERANV
ncbi:DUF7538 family protein [Halorubrum pallidum]